MKIKKIGKFFELYLLNLLISLDQFVNATLAGDPDETISSRLGRRWPNSLTAKIVNILFFWQRAKAHCIAAIEPDEGKNDLLPNMTEAKIVKVIVIVFLIIVIGCCIFI